MERDQGFWPATMYIEGLDQYRGWFQSSLLVAVGALGRGAPFKECVTHGWTVDGEGKAMHKSLGNGMDPAEIFDKYGADLLRLWAGSADYHVDVRCSDEIFKQLSQNYLKFRNTAKFCLDNLVGFDADHLVQPADMLPLDKWAVTRLNDLITKVFAAYDNYEFHVVSHMVNDFCVVDLSSFYFDILKDRLYCDAAEGLERRSAQTALFLILDAMTRLFAPILAFTCDEIWLAMPHRSSDDARNVLFNEMVQPYTDIRPLRGRDGQVGPHRRPAQRRQRRAGAGPRRQDHRQEPGGRGGSDRSRRGCLPDRDGQPPCWPIC